MLVSAYSPPYFDWIDDNIIEPLDAVSLATLIVALATFALASATVWLARQTQSSVAVSKDALLAGIRAILADAKPEVARAQGVQPERPEVHQGKAKIEIKVPLRNVGSGIALLFAPRLLEAKGLEKARKVESVVPAVAVPAGEVIVVRFVAEIDESKRLEAAKELHEARRFTVGIRCRDMNGEQEIRTEATIVYTPAGAVEGPTYSGKWNFEEVRLFRRDDTKPFAELPRSQTFTVTGAAVIGAVTTITASSEDVSPGGPAES
jgi:hypothetical protein